MENHRVWAKRSTTGILLGAFALSGCMFGGGQAAKDVEATRNQPALAQIDAAKELNGQSSELITTLLNRSSVIPQGSSFATVTNAVLASNARTAESDLRAARLRAQAKSTNWLPSIGPVVSLTSLGDIVAQLVIEQVLFDNGRAKAERAFAAHDVEVAAVGLSQDTNARAATALDLYIQAQRARAEAEVAEKARARMSEFVHIIERRVNGGVSNMADLSVARSKIQELNADHARAREAEATSLAELEAMANLPLGTVSGLTSINTGSQGLFPLNVLKARAEGNRTVAQARVSRADLLPGVVAGGTLGDGGLDVGVQVSGDQLINLGTGSALEAIQASQDSARRGVVQAEEDNRRVVRRLEQKRIALERQQAESAALVAEARRTYELFFSQFQNSGRPIMDVVNIYENAMRLERDSVRLKYELAQIQVEIASLYGTLVSGGDV